MHEPSQHIKRRPHAAGTSQIFNACQNQEVVKYDEQIFITIIRTTNAAVPRTRTLRGGKMINKRSPSYAAVNYSHGMTEGMKIKMNKESGTKKDIIIVEERELGIFNSVSGRPQKPLKKIIQRYRDMCR